MFTEFSSLKVANQWSQIKAKVVDDNKVYLKDHKYAFLNVLKHVQRIHKYKMSEFFLDYQENKFS